MAYKIHHVSENLILNRGCSHKYSNNENIHVDNNKIIPLEILVENVITINNEFEQMCLIQQLNRVDSDHHQKILLNSNLSFQVLC